MMRIRLVILALGTAALAAAPAAAQVAGPDVDDGRGLVVGVSLGATRFSAVGHDMGGGFGVALGYGVTPALTLFARGSTGYLSSHLDLGARYSFGGPTTAVRPFLEGALSRVGSTRAEERAAGYGVTGGAGVEVRLARTLALDLGVSTTVGQLHPEDTPVADFTSTRANLGIRWRP